MDMSNEYAVALEAGRAAATKYMKALADYRALKIGDGEYLAARAESQAAAKAFEEAYAKEQAWDRVLADICKPDYPKRSAEVAA